MTGIAGYTKFQLKKGTNTSPIYIMTRELLIGDHQKIHVFHDRFIDVGVVTIKDVDNCFYATNEDGNLGCLVYGQIFDIHKHLSFPSKKEGNSSNLNHDKSNPAEHMLHVYESQGVEAFSGLNGSFCAVIFNRNQPKVLLIMDRFGTRPIYYAFKDGELIFSSHSRVILNYPSFPRKLNEKTLVKFLMYGKIGILGDDTWFEGIKLMPPSSVLEFTGKDFGIRRYWDLEYRSELDERDAVNLLVKKFRKAVNIRASAIERGLCLLLSGGLDSRSVLGALNKENLHKVTAITYGVRNCDDIIIAKMVTRKLGVKHLVIEYDPDKLVSYAKQVVYLTDGQDIVSVAYLPYVAEKLRRLGFRYYLQGYMFDVLLGGIFLSWKILHAHSFHEFLTILAKKYAVFTMKELKKLLSPKLYRNVPFAIRAFVKAAKESKGDCFGNRCDYFTINTRSRRYILMGSIILREFLEELLPAIDNEVIDIIRRIPPQYRFKHRIYRKFLMSLNPDLAKIPYQKTLLPPLIPTPLWLLSIIIVYFLIRIIKLFSKGRLSYEHTYFNFDNILRTSVAWKKLVEDTLLNEDSLIYRYGYINKDYVVRLVKEHMSGKNNGEKLAFLISVELFLRCFFDQNTCKISNRDC